MLHLVYKAIKKKLLADVTPTPEYVDWYYGQYLEDEMEDGGELLWTTPAVFIEFLPLQWTTRGDLSQRAELVFNVHLVNESMDSDERRMTDTTSTGHMAQAARVFSALQGFRANLKYIPGFESIADADDRVMIESITRVSSEVDHNLRRQVVSVQQFRATIFDYGAQRNWQQVLAAIEEEVEVVESV